MRDLRQSPLWAKYLEQIGWEAEKIDGNFIYFKRIPFLGTLIKFQRPEKIDFGKVISFAKQNGAFFLKIEPKVETPNFAKFGLHKDSWPLTPSKSILIDLEPLLEEIYDAFAKKTRYSIRQAEKNKVKTITLDDNELFAHLWIKNRERFFGSKKEVETLFNVFKKTNQAKILFSQKGEDALAGVMLIFSDQACYYMYAFSTPLGKKLQAASLCAWEAVKYAKKNGAKIFDFEGIYDERFHSTTKSWQGFTHFKKGFGGKEVSYPGSYSKYFWPKFW